MGRTACIYTHDVRAKKQYDMDLTEQIFDPSKKPSMGISSD